MARPLSMPAGSRGVTLLELLVAVAILGTLLALGGWGSAAVLQRWQGWRGIQQVLDDCREAQARAERGSGTALQGGALVTARSFLVFDPPAGRFALYDWEDADGDGRPEAGESRRVWSRELPPGVRFGWAAGIDRKACGNAPGVPAAAVTFGSAGYPPCDGRPCLRFDHQGFSAMGPGAVYLVDGAQSYALTATRPGHFTSCRWDGAAWR